MQVFVSYARKDTMIMEEVCSELRARNHDIWLDVESITGGSDWRASIEGGIARSEVFVVLISPRVAEHPDYTREELDCAPFLNKPIIPVYLAAVAELPGGFNLTLSGRQRIDLYPSFSMGMERLLRELAGGQAASAPDSRTRLEVRRWAADNVSRFRVGAHKLQREARQRELGKKALRIGGLVAAGAATAAVAAAASRSTVRREAEALSSSDAQDALAAYRRKIDDRIGECQRELSRLANSTNPEESYEKFCPVLAYVLGQLDSTEPPVDKVRAHRLLVESLRETLRQLDLAMRELQRGDQADAMVALQRMAEQFFKTLEQHGELLAE